MSGNIYEGIVSIDLGTTNCVTSVIDDKGELVVIKNHIGEIMTPSYIYYGNDGEVLVGKPAKEKLKDAPDNVFHSYKPYISTLKNLGEVNGEVITPEKCSAEMLKYLKECAEVQTGVVMSKAVITVPAYFSENQKYATKMAAEIAGLEVIMLPTEPTAGAYFYSNNVTDSLPMNVVVYDLGGGTFDACIQTIRSLRDVEVQSNEGNRHLGGDDVNKALAKYINRSFSKLTNDKKVLLINACNDAKIYLSNEYAKGNKEAVYEFDLPFMKNKKVTTNDLLTVLEPIITKTMTVMEKLFDKSIIKVKDIDEVLLIGGSTRLPMIRERLVEFLDDERFNLEYFDKYLTEPDLAVGYGANNLIREVIKFGEDVVTNTLPIAIKVVVEDNDYKEIFKSNIMLPSRKAVTVYNNAVGQDSIKIIIVEDDNDVYSEEATELGSVTVKLPETTTAVGEYEITLKLALNSQGILNAQARIMNNMKKTQPLNVKIPIERTATRWFEVDSNKVKSHLKTSFGGE